MLVAERLRTHQSDLLAGEPAIRDEMARLEAVRGVCRIVLAQLLHSSESRMISGSIPDTRLIYHTQAVFFGRFVVLSVI